MYRLGNWILEKSAASGTGLTITLDGAVPGFASFSSQFADLSHPSSLAHGSQVVYSIQDGNNRELGVGFFRSNSNELERTTIMATLVAGAYTEAPAAVRIHLSGTDVLVGVTDYLTLQQWGEDIRQSTVQPGGQSWVLAQDPVTGVTGLQAFDAGTY
jgi:hypothetical protein